MLTLEPSAPRSIADTAEMGMRITDLPSTLNTAYGNCELSNYTGCCSDESRWGQIGGGCVGVDQASRHPSAYCVSGWRQLQYLDGKGRKLQRV